MNCEDVREEIELYVLGGTDQAENRLIEEHLSRCPNCRCLEQQYVLLLTNLRGRQGSITRAWRPAPRRPVEREHGQDGRATAEATLVRKICSTAEVLLKRERIRRRLGRIASTAASVAAAFLLAACVWQVWHSGSKPAPISGFGLHKNSKAPLRNNPYARNRGQNHEIGKGAPAKTLWQRANAISTGIANAGDIVVDNGTVFFLTEDKGAPTVSAIDADSGKTLWQSELISCGYLETDGERLYCVSVASQARIELAALDTGSGQVQWTFERSESSNSLYQVSKPSVIRTGQVCWVCKNSIYVLDARTGEQTWSRSFDEESCMSRAAVAGHNVYVAGRNGIYCVDAGSGQVQWHLPYRFYTWAGAKPLIAAESGRLFVTAGSKDGRSVVQCIDTSRQRCLWEKLVPRVTHISADRAYVYLRCQDVLALEQGTGEPVWEVKASGCSPVTECDESICFVDRTQEGRLVAIDRRTGQTSWQVPGLHSCNAFVRSGRRGYLKTEDSVVLAFAFDS